MNGAARDFLHLALPALALGLCAGWCLRARWDRQRRHDAVVRGVREGWP
jgi:hypothetical protein